MEKFTVNPIGRVSVHEEGMRILIFPEYKAALKELDRFSHVNVFWWFNNCDNEESRRILQAKSPYKGSPDIMGVFATRSDYRPNPIALTAVRILNIDHENGIIHIPYIDAFDNTPVIDLKPYTPSFDRIENFKTPSWCAHWPKSVEESADFDWESQFNF